MPTPLRAAIFDLDGTLLDSLGDIGTAMNRALADHGRPVHPLEAYRHFVGDGVHMLVERVLGPGQHALHEPLLASYRAYYERHLFDSTQPYPGVPQALEALAARGLRLGVLSNKSDRYTRQLVTQLFPGVTFGAVYGERAGIARKPDPGAALSMAQELGVRPAECAFVGDTAVDMRTARAAGMLAVGVTWGFRDVEELRAHGAERLATRAEELVGLLGAPREG